MTPARLDLARRLAASPKWRWRGGMRMADATTGAARVFGSGSRIWSDQQVGTFPNADPFTGEPMRGTTTWPPAGTVPDLADPATAGCLIALLREVTENFDLEPEPEVADGQGWCCSVCDGDVWIPHDGATMGEAVARALLAVWDDEDSGGDVELAEEGAF